MLLTIMDQIAGKMQDSDWAQVSQKGIRGQLKEIGIPLCEH